MNNLAPIGISKTIIQQAGDTLSLPKTAKIVKEADPKKDIVTKIISPKSKPENVNAVWAEAAKIQNSIIPGEVSDQNKNGGNKFKIGDKEIQLGGSKDLTTDTKAVSVDTISTPDQQNALKTQIKTATSSDDIKKVTAPTTDEDKKTLQGKIKSLQAGTDTNVNLLDDNNKTITSLDKNRAELNKRREEVRLATKNDNLTAEQKTALKAEQKALDESLKMIDGVPKVFATQNGARLKVDNGSNIRSISRNQITSDDKLDGYEGMFQAKDEKNQTEVKVPTVKQAYNSFAQQMKESTGKDFTLGDNQNLVMYRDGDNVKFLIVDSKTETNGNRKTIITEPIIAKRKEDGETAIGKPLVKKSGTSGQETVEFSAKQFNYGAGEDIKINLVKDGKPQVSFMDESTTGVASKGKNQSGITIPLENISISEGKITGAGRYIQNTYKITPTDEQIKLLRTTSKHEIFSENKKDSDGTYTISQNDLKTISSELNSPIYTPVVKSLNENGKKLTDITLDKIDLDKLNDSQYSEDIDNYRYRVLMTYWMLHPESRDNKFTKILKNYNKNDSSLFSTEPMPNYWINPLNEELQRR